MSVKQRFDLTGRTAIVTGGSRGLGLQIAEALGEMGARVLLTARKADELEQAVAHLQAQGVSASAIPADMGRPEAIAPFADAALARLGQVDILVNNAGANWAAPMEDYPLDAWTKLLNVNLTGIFLLTQAIGRRSMIPRRRGKVLNVASIAGLRGNRGAEGEMIGYNTTKGGLVNFTRALAAEWGEHDINVNALAPGFFETKMTRGLLAKAEDALTADAPLRRLGDDEDLKGAAVLLCSDAGRHITGQVLAVDGGVMAA
ncbi:MAG TPA: SDR family oxidoreductase [Burkholderiaceae bacterium]|nr:SDR family oxidoreductase [Burkholderiaceae bacterium]